MQHHRWVEKEAAGVVAAIIAYNYPNQLALAKLAPALAAGCTVVLKSAPDTPLITLALGELIANHTDIPAGVVNVLSGADPRGRRRADHQSRRGHGHLHRFHPDRPTDHGRRQRHAQEACSSNWAASPRRSCSTTPTSTPPRCSRRSHGHPRGPGLCADVAAAGAAQAPRRDRRAGQEQLRRWCGTATRPIPSTYMGPLISEKQRDKVDGMVKRAVEAGATLVTGGEKVDPGYFYTPTLLTDVDPDSEIAQEEVFGPVLVVIALRRRRRCGAHRQQLHLRPFRCGVRRPGPCAGGGPPHPDRHLLDQRRQLLQPRQPVRRLQAVRHRQGDGQPRGSRSSWSPRRSRRWFGES